MMVNEVTKDLKNGLSLEETLQKHNTSLKELFKDINKYPVKRENRTPNTPEWKYIQYTKQHTYRLIKGVDNHRVSFGTYKTFEDAKKVREEMSKIGWDKSRLDEILTKNNIRSQRRDKKKIKRSYEL